jgi:heme oxygenase
MSDPPPTEHEPCLDTDDIPATARQLLQLHSDDIPTLDDVVEDQDFDELAAHIKAQLLTELEPLLQEMVHRAFASSVRLVALNLKHAFEQELDKQLDDRLHALVEESVLRACRQVRL